MIKAENAILERQLAMRLVEAAQGGYRSDELRDIVSALDPEGSTNAATLAALQSAFENSRHATASEIGDCSVEDDFNGLLENYELFASTLRVNVSWELEKLEEVYLKYTDYEERRADEMADEYKDRYRETQVSEETVRNVFASPRSERKDKNI